MKTAQPITQRIKKKLWNTDKRKATFYGTYTTSRGSRTLTLVPLDNKKLKPTTFQSWQQAKQFGWSKVKGRH